MNDKVNLFRVGDKVYEATHGWGKVINIVESNLGLYPVVVEFEKDYVVAFTVDGREFFNNLRVLSFTKYDFVNGGFSQKRPIDYESIKTGSIVKINLTDNIIDSSFIDKVVLHRPFEVVFWETSYRIDSDGFFHNRGYHKKYSTFYQNGQCICFSSDGGEIDYISEVIEY